MKTADPACLFCAIVAEQQPAARVYADETAVAFLDHRPVFPGHVLIVPRTHYETLNDLPASRIGPLFQVAQRLARAVETGLSAGGTFVAMNNRISQSVPHVHIHVVPRRKGDGLRGFFWPRTKYASPEEMAEVAARIAAAVEG
jgi:histidine triad (HIT) family protein